MNIRRAIVLITMLICGLVSSAGATVIVDTGPGTTLYSGYSLFSGQWLGAEFSLLNDTTLTDIYGWMFSVSSGETGHIGIYDDGGDIPGTELFSSQFTVGNVPQNTYDWFGLSGLDWGLAAGDYWVTFEARTGDTIDAGMPYLSPNPLLNEVLGSSGGTSWRSFDNMDLGVRIEGTPVPEPSTFLLLGGGLAGLAFYARRRRKE